MLKLDKRKVIPKKRWIERFIVFYLYSGVIDEDIY